MGEIYIFSVPVSPLLWNGRTMSENISKPGNIFEVFNSIIDEIEIETSIRARDSKTHIVIARRERKEGRDKPPSLRKCGVIYLFGRKGSVDRLDLRASNRKS